MFKSVLFKGEGVFKAMMKVLDDKSKGFTYKKQKYNFFLS